MLAVNFRQSRREVTQYREALGLSFPVLLDQDGSVTATYKAWGHPMTFLIGREGEVVGQIVGAREWTAEPARRLLEALLAPTPERSSSRDSAQEPR